MELMTDSMKKEIYERYCLGLWEVENPMIKKEGNKMIESINLIDLYANKHRESIEKETKEKIEKIKNESSHKNVKMICKNYIFHNLQTKKLKK